MNIASAETDGRRLLKFQEERNWFIKQLQGVSRMKRLRITFLSGDVHCAAVSVLKTLTRQMGNKNKAPDIPPAVDYRYMVNVVTSAIVNTPYVSALSCLQVFDLLIDPLLASLAWFLRWLPRRTRRFIMLKRTRLWFRDYPACFLIVYLCSFVGATFYA